MEKINYVCGANELGYIFPKRKWYESKKQRICQIYLNATEQYKMGTVPDILLTIGEEMTETILREINIPDYDSDEKSDLLLATMEYLSLSYKKCEEMVVFDGNESDVFIHILSHISSLLNRLTVITAKPENYQMLFEHLLEETGLIAECASEFRQLYDYTNKKDRRRPCYQEQKNRLSKCMIWYADGGKKIPVRQLPYGSFFVDTTANGRMQREITGKRPDIAYLSLPKCLDTIVKLRYNTLVKEGILNTHIIKNQNKNSALRERDYNDGRKEKYLDLRRLKKI